MPFFLSKGKLEKLRRANIEETLKKIVLILESINTISSSRKYLIKSIISDYFYLSYEEFAREIIPILTRLYNDEQDTEIASVRTESTESTNNI